MGKQMKNRTCTGCGTPLVPRRRRKDVPEGHKVHQARGMCGTCYEKARAAGALEDVPPAVRPPLDAEVVQALVDRGMSDRQIAEHTGYHERTVLRVRQAAGIPAAIPPTPRQYRAAHAEQKIAAAAERASVAARHPLAALFAGVGHDALEGAACTGAGLPGSSIPDPCSDDPDERAAAARTLCPTCPVFDACRFAGRRERGGFVYAAYDTGEGREFREPQRGTSNAEVLAVFADAARHLEAATA